jgi:P-type Cu2+ transporter
MRNITFPEDFASSETEIVVFVVVNAKLNGYVALSDEIRPQSAPNAINLLKKCSNKCKPSLRAG